MSMPPATRFPQPFIRLGLPLVLSLLSPWLMAADWPQFLGPDRNGTSPETNLIHHWPASGPIQLWIKPVGTGYSAPSVRNNRLVLHHRKANQEIVECFDATTGQSLWSHAYKTTFVDPYGYNNGPRSTPALSETHAYTLGADGTLLCLTLSEGTPVWSHETSKEWQIPEAFFGVGSSPLLDNGRLFVMVGGQPNSGIVAFNAITGEILWENVGQQTWEGQPMLGWPGERTVQWRTSEKQASYATPVLATVHGEQRLFCLMRQGLTALDPNTGSHLFSRWFRARVNESVNAANPIVHENQIFISAAYYKVGSVLLQLDPNPSRFTETWANTNLEAHWTTPILHDGYLYAFSGRNEPDARFRCINLNSGELMWDRDESWSRGSRQPDAYGRGSAILANDQLIVLGEGGLLGLFEPTPTQPVELARHQIPELSYPCWTAPVLSNTKLYLRNEKFLVCLSLEP
jgi:outer membrane protein assembly factor BamB